jgi:hypothetical protein
MDPLSLSFYNDLAIPESSNFVVLLLCVCGSRSLTLREEHGLRMFEERFLRRIFGTRRNTKVLKKTAQW